MLKYIREVRLVNNLLELAGKEEKSNISTLTSSNQLHITVLNTTLSLWTPGSKESVNLIAKNMLGANLISSGLLVKVLSSV